ncbi:MAG: tyrosine-type recombinase/integrase [Actinobacteria bacterium]|nr:tyrosine-type recombinase/integrase [Actinomycetota bacterium]
MTLRDAALMLDEAVRDKSYRAAPLGQEVGRFLRYAATSRDFSPRSIDDYESILAPFAAEHAHLAFVDFDGAAGAERVLEFVARRWGSAAPGTRRKAFAVLSSFFGWAVRFDRIAANPVLRIDRPRKRGVERHAHHPDRIKRIIARQPALRDQTAIALMARLGLRKNELRLLRWRDVDLEDGELRVHGKGGKVVDVPIVYEDLQQQLAQLALDCGADPDHYLLYPERVGNLPGAATRGLIRAFPERPMQQSTMHRWWTRCLRQAKVPHFPMHELRHSAVTEFIRATGDVAAAQRFARHASVATTVDVYGHLDRDDLIRGMKLAGERWAVRSKE